MPEITLFSSPNWEDYELLDSGDGLKLERFGARKFIRPEHQAVWRPALPNKQWDTADAIFQPDGDESGGKWQSRHTLEPAWKMQYQELVFMARMSNSRHLGVFPEQATHWEWISDLIAAYGQPINVLNLFGYTGLASLAAAKAGARVTHLDASKKSVTFARENQLLSGLGERPIRWIVDDAVKFVMREARRGTHYDGVILDPPKFGRGPKGEVWEFSKMLSFLLEQIKPILTEKPLFVVITAYAIRASALSLHYAIEEMMNGYSGKISSGELTLKEKSAGRILSMAITSRWSSVRGMKGKK